MENVVAMVLAGGAFSSLRILAGRRAKAAIPFGGIYRIIDFALSNLMNSNIDYVGILAQYRPASLIDHIEVGASWDLYGRTRSVKILPPYQGDDDSDWYKGTADAIYQNLNFITDHRPSEVLVLAGENIYSMDYQKLLQFHREKRADCTLVCNPLPTQDSHRFGITTLGDDGRILAYHEKPKTVSGTHYSAGVYVFNTQFLIDKLTEDAVKSGSRHNFADNIIPDMLNCGNAFYGYGFDDYWAYCGTIEEYWQANMDLLEDPPKLDLWRWKIRTNLDDRNVGGRQPAVFLPTAHVESSIVSSGCTIGGTVEHSVLSPGVVVEEGAVIRNSIIFHESVIRKGAILDRVISDKDVIVGERSRVGTRDVSVVNTEFLETFSSGITVLGKESQIGMDAQLGRNVMVFPGKSVKDQDYVESGGVIR
ncbi:glucose-1-phosphate adenylyltransferase [candidate division KSB3 bacterium]|uniref:Glucose-1-phosphate adenylyltransferase n=1 Tax=candidate division KSB3 bacterium TaxID=2044937 RepID=A0A2G6KII0_9BACT|nr:MAG: glucose-1-phosphate adenylyltransferase [candidate division KSB3 bacterium]